ncbi:MAG: cupredoxin domain-containing protein [Myxococcota bacterium]|nr:cupredoxin domain-containing protein [Myxococcota bacterium]
MMLHRVSALLIATLLIGGCSRAQAESSAPVREVSVAVGQSYVPAQISATAGEHLRLKLTRETEGCTSEVVFPTMGIRRDLPLHHPVAIDLGTVSVGEIPFHCGMDMVRGKVVVYAAAKGTSS